MLQILTSRKPSRFVLEVIIALATDEDSVSYLVSAGINKVVLDILASSLQNEKRAKSLTTLNSFESTILQYFIRMSQYPESAQDLAFLGAINMLSKLLGIGSQVAIDAFMAITFIVANTSSENGTLIFTKIRTYTL
jgi:hypothetical protein